MYVCVLYTGICTYVCMHLCSAIIYLEQPIKDVIITVPPFFNMAQRRAIHL